ncbi:unnamed protein product [Rotaria sp. Silwood1]|nr:unnamed protein product [Rotaria sp. Silwood1]CAF1345965.1 unnamed protein product [Rotaria sp. Silwood1]CAF3564218.1 unnamed protein product [Rotaria sp. Silwood1]
MISAAYLSKHFKRITIIESDDVLSDTLNKSTPNELLAYHCHLESPTSIGRSGVSQIYQIHVLKAEVFNVLHELFPHLKYKLKNEYNVRLYSLKKAIQLIVDQSVNIVQDVKYRLKQHVDSQFNLIVPTEQIHFGCGYISFIGERFKTGNPSLDSISIIGCNINSSDNNTGCYITPIRNAMCAFNPQHAQGMTHALRHARDQRVAAITEECWLASTISDWKTPTLKIIKN